MSSSNNRLKRPIWREGETLWAERRPSEEGLWSKPDWMMVPEEVRGYDRGPAKRRVLRQYLSPCPVTGESVTTRELEGGVYCWVNPVLSKGVMFSFNPGVRTESAQLIDRGGDV